MRADDICPRPDFLPPLATRPASPPIYLASVYACDSTDQAEALLSGREDGYVYQRDRHPNADLLAKKCRDLHGAERAAVAPSGMSALALAMLSQLSAGDHIVVARQLYGKSLTLLTKESARFNISSTVVETCDLKATAAAITPRTKMIVVETIANPLLRVADLSGLAELAHRAGALLLVDNTFATPILCRPLEFGVDLVMESMSKMMNGHSDVMMGLLCGHARHWDRIWLAMTAWGLTSSPLDCWLTARGLATLHLRIERAAANALKAAEFLCGRAEVAAVDYPGLPRHPDHALACRQFRGGFGTIVAFHLHGGRASADRFIAAATNIPFYPSLGEVCTSLSHPESTSHRGLSPEQRAALGIGGGTIRLSVGCESPEHVLEALQAGLNATRR